jgi:hypothetical protein
MKNGILKRQMLTVIYFLLFISVMTGIAYGEGSISGTISYGGLQTGTLLVAALDAPISCTGPNDANAVSIIAVEPGDVSFPETYELSGVPDGTYYVASAIKSCGMDCPMEFTAPWGIYDGCGSITPIVISSGNAETGINITLVDGTVADPNPFFDRSFDVEVVSSYSEGMYRVSFRVRDSGHNASSVSVAGPLITGSLDLVYNAAHTLWENSPSLLLGSTKPVQPLTYTFTITDDVGPIIIEATLETTDYCDAFPTNISPSGGEEVRGTPVFTWDEIGPGYEYQIDVTDPSRQKIWSSGPVAGPPVMYEGPQIYFGLTYGYFFHTGCSNGSYTIIEKNFVYMGPAITKAVSFTETFANHPTRPDGWHLHLLADVDDPAGVQGNIQSVTSVNTDTVIDPATYDLNHASGNTYKEHPDINRDNIQRGTYRFTVLNNQGLIVQRDAAPIDNPVELDVITGLSVSDYSTTPTVTFNPVAGADKYRLTIYNTPDLQKKIYQSSRSDTPSFDVPADLMTIGNDNYIRAEAHDINMDDGDGVDDLENRSLNHLTFTPTYRKEIRLLGDVDEDRDVDISDVILVLRIALGLDDPHSCADIDGSGNVDISDVILTLRLALELDELQICFECLDDDPYNGIYRMCNYFPLDPGNQWNYTTGNRFIPDDMRTCDSGYTGILYGTDTYEYSGYVQNKSYGLLFAGCQYDEGIFEDWGVPMTFIKPDIKAGETVNAHVSPGGPGEPGFDYDVRLVGEETVTVPAGSFDALKIEIVVRHDDASCSYKTTLWLARGIGPVKIHRTEADPANCLGFATRIMMWIN